jgi:hypothetical protein
MPIAVKSATFDCTKDARPVAQIICSDSALSRADLILVQTYYALRQQAGEAAWQSLKQEFINFVQQGLVPCTTQGFFYNETATCIQRAYGHQRNIWFSRLVGPAREEATRPIEQHILLQLSLQAAGFIPHTEVIDGIYGVTTRTAISGWQRANNRPDTSFISNDDAAILSGAVNATS